MRHAKLDLVEDIALSLIGVVTKTVMVELVRLIVHAAQVLFYTVDSKDILQNLRSVVQKNRVIFMIILLGIIPTNSDSGTFHCGSCYGAETASRPCCNTCEEVKDAMEQKGWSYDSSKFSQCYQDSSKGSIIFI